MRRQTRPAAAWLRTRPKLRLPAAAKENVEDLLKVETLAVEVGLGLVRFVEGGSESPLLRRIGAIRRQLAAELGYILPAIRLKDNLSLKAHEYTLCLKGVEIARYEIPAGCELAVAVGKPTSQIQGIVDPRTGSSGIPALWVPVRTGRTMRAKPGTQWSIPSPSWALISRNSSSVTLTRCFPETI